MTLSLDIASLTEAYTRGSMTPVTVIEEIYGRIAAEGERPIWITLVPKEKALAAAATAKEGPLHGIPFAVKDNIDVVGLPTTCACPEFAYTPDRSACVVELMEAAGAIVIGKTNLDQFATGLNGTRSAYGIPACAFDPAYISGGSSSGSALAVAKGLVTFALGTDTAGSGRVPAAFNNIVGLKPTKGVISTRGVVPACRTQDVVSIFALTTADAAQVFSVAGAFDPEDAFSRRPPCALSPAELPAALRIGVPAAELEFFGDESFRQLYRAAIARARNELGARIVEIDFSPFREAAALLYQGPWIAERLAAVQPFVGRNAAAMNETVRTIILGAEDVSSASVFGGFYRLAELMRRAETEWRKMDALLLPTSPTIYRIADMLGDPVQLNSNLGLYTNFVNLMDLSALAIPAGFGESGLPCGVTLVAPAFADGQLATLGDQLHRAVPGARLGATTTELCSTPKVLPKGRQAISVAVVGAHLSGQPLNSQLTERGARLVRTARTSAGYSFYELPGTAPRKPGLVFDGKGAGDIEVEIWEMDLDKFGSFVALIPPPLGIGTLTLSCGGTVKGFLCEAHAVHGATDITATGGWRGWLSQGSRGAN